jgi:NMD protein affecting ribosome stability and mRNA decay
MTALSKSSQGIRNNLRNDNDPYLPPKGKGMKEPLRCKNCDLIYWNKRWYPEEEAKRLYGKRKMQGVVICPGCRKYAEKAVGGLVKLEGSFLREHVEEIFNLIRNEEKKMRASNPLDRIIEVKKKRNGVEVTTTTERLAQRLGKAIHRAYSGTLHFSWSDGVKFTRVQWERNNGTVR